MPSLLRQYVDTLVNFRDFSGNATRKAFWSFAAIHLGILILLVILTWIAWPFAWVFIIYQVVVLVPCIAAMVRRLNDAGRSGWWVLITLVPFLGWILMLVFLLLGTSTDEAPRLSSEPFATPSSEPAPSTAPPSPQQIGSNPRQAASPEVRIVITLVMAIASLVVIASTFLPWAESSTLRLLGSWVGSSESPDLNAFELAGYIHEVSDGDIDLGILLVLFAIPMLLALVTLIISLAGLMIRRWNPAMGILSIICGLVMCLITVGLAVAGTALQSDRDFDLSMEPGLYLVAIASVVILVFSIWGSISLSRKA